MKIVGRTESDLKFLCLLTDDEIHIIVHGTKYLSDCQKRAKQMMGEEVPISQLFESLREFECFKAGTEVGSVRKQLNELLKSLTPIEEFHRSKTKKGGK